MDNPVRLFLHVMYQTLETITGFFGVTPPQVGEAIGAVVLVSLLYTMVQARRGRTRFTLDD